jgi:type II secretory pathway component PulL
MSRKVLALDIRHHGVAAVIVQSSLRENRISAFAYAPLAAEDAASGTLADALGSLAESLDFSGCDCVASLPADLFSFRNLQIPFRSRKKIQMVLPFELEPSLPYAVDEIVLDFSPVRHDAVKDSTDVLAAILPKAELERFLETLAAFGLDPETITIGGLPLALYHTHQTEVPGDRLVLDVDRGTATLFAAVDNQIQWIRSFPLAENAAPGVVKRQVMLSLAAFEEQYGYDLENSEIVVGGHGLQGTLAKDAIDDALGVSSYGSDLAPQQGIDLPPTDGPAAARWDARRMDNALALGLAEIGGFQGLNIYRSQFPARKLWGKYKDQFVKTGWIAAAVLVLMFFGQLIESYTLNRRIAQIDRQARAIYKAAFPQATKITDPFAEMTINLRETKKAAGVNTASENQVRSIDVLNSISQQIPASVNVDISRLVIAADNILISGQTGGYDSVDEVKNSLERIPFFKRVTITSSNIDRSGKEVRFQIKAER